MEIVKSRFQEKMDKIIKNDIDLAERTDVDNNNITTLKNIINAGENSISIIK